MSALDLYLQRDEVHRFMLSPMASFRHMQFIDALKTVSIIIIIIIIIITVRLL